MRKTAFSAVVWGIVPSGHVTRERFDGHFMGVVGNSRAEKQNLWVSLVSANDSEIMILCQIIAVG
ncbi:MAG: hypothetical protein A2X66_09160 [Ignavibacteria bacterium GWA2_54_16]|nr:MAG: hypothetical protein A2X66_09160 [Ignavibacteria bacterium GWA2_54_16]